MPWVDDFTTDYFASGRYSFPYGPPSAVAPHDLRETGGLLIWYDSHQASGPPYDVEIDVIGGSEPYLLVAGFITADLGTGCYGGFENTGGGGTGVVIGSAGGSAASNGGPCSWPSGDFTLKTTLDPSGALATDIGGTVVGTVLNSAIMAGLVADATILFPLAYMYAVGPGGFPGSIDVHLSEWRVGASGGGPPPPPTFNPKAIQVGEHAGGLVLRPDLRRLVSNGH